MNDLLKDLCTPGNIIGLGESTHGSATEFLAKYNAILSIARENPDLPITFYFEAYSEPFEKLVTRLGQSARADISVLVRECIQEIYSVWQTKEIYDFLCSLAAVRTERPAPLHMIGVDYKNKTEKQSMDGREMLANRAQVMFKNICEAHSPDTIHFFSAHNSHVGKYADETGALLATEYGSHYIAVAQYVYQGEIRAKEPGGDYVVVTFSHESKPHALAHMARNYFSASTPSPAVLETSDPRLVDVQTMSQIGYFWPLEKPWYVAFGSDLFDYVVLHMESVTATVLEDRS